MKVILSIFALVVLAQADRDWSQIRSREIDPFTRKIVSMPMELQKGSGQRIVGGQEAEEHSIPHQVALFINTPDGTFFCGGSLLSRNYVITVAHCVDIAFGVEVILGAHNIRVNEPTQVSILSASIIIHSGWDSANIRNDIALIRLQQQAPLNLFIQTIDLPTYSDQSNAFSGRNSQVSGWGRFSDNVNTISETLNFVTVPVISNLVCNIRFLGLIQASNICSSGDDGRGACNGDSGGPVTVDRKLVGLVSFGLSIGCEVGWPSVHTRVTSYLDWIAANSDVEIRP